MNESVLILAGGLATRLGPLSKKTPKSLVPILGKPFLSYQLELLQKAGFNHVVLALGHLAHKIEAYVDQIKRPNFSIECVTEPCLLGTAGAISHARDKLSQHFFVLYGDSYLLCDFQKVRAYFYESQQDALMTVYENHNEGDRSNVIFRRGKLIEYDKSRMHSDMTYIEYGVSMFKQSVFDDCQFSDLSHVFRALLKHKKIAALEVHEPFYEIGTDVGIHRFASFLENRNTKANNIGERS